MVTPPEFIAIVVAAALIALALESVVKSDVDFVREIRPILSHHCFACHGPDDSSREAELSLVTFEKATRELESGVRAVVPGDRKGSAAWRRINNPRDPMPPREAHKALSPEQIELMGRWIDQGASYEPHWAYVSPADTPAPAVGDDAWPRDEVDRFILARLEHEGLDPAPEADPVTLIRRVTFDLTGLPPQPADIDAYLHDNAPDPLARVVDRLLGSPHFGERVAVHWLDLVRYADTVGYHGDQEHHIWPYRDYVINAFNDNLPFDRFTIEQLAGDLLPDSTQARLIATGYNRLIQTTHEGGLQLKEYRAIYQADRIRNFSGTWLGATVGCAQCHDHKYDPYTTRDFYALGAFFADIDDEEHLRKPYDGLNTTPTRRAPEMRIASDQERRHLESLDARLAALRAERDATEDLDARERVESEIVETQGERDSAESVLPLTMFTLALAEPREVRVLPRGNWLDESGEVVVAAVPTFLGALEVDGRATRLDLARWLVTPDSEGGVAGLTARVFVNRVWALLHGQGLCPSTEDFGGQGRPPDHPALLDRLALDFVASGWDVKALMRRLTLTSTYRQSSIPGPLARERDPENELFSRQSRHRLSAEMVRDTMLAVSGLLVETVGGPSVKPPQPAGYYRHLNFPPRRYQASTDDAQWRRGVYMHWQRQYLHPMLRAFDAPTREECTSQRVVSNTPLAALALMNDPTMVEAVRRFAERTLHAGSDDRARLVFAIRASVGRPPQNAESAVLMGVLRDSLRYYASHPDEAEALLAVGTVPQDDTLDPITVAAWTQVTRVVLNLHETITRE